jgi:protein-S-isoprenylcysteine O-methyltransferase Ste14
MLLVIIWFAWFFSELFLNRFFRSASYGKGSQDKGSVRVIWITIGLANTAGILSSIFVSLPVCSSPMAGYSGAGLILAGMILRFISVLTLGRFFTVDVTIRDNHRLKKEGLYRFIRHPSYLGSIISFIGFGISLNNWISLFIISAPVTLAMIYRISIEEKLLKERFGGEYIDYVSRTSRLIPWIY